MSDEDDLKLARKSLDGDASSLLRLIDRRIARALGAGDDETLERARKIVEIAKAFHVLDEEPAQRNLIMSEALGAIRPAIQNMADGFASALAEQRERERIVASAAASGVDPAVVEQVLASAAAAGVHQTVVEQVMEIMRPSSPSSGCEQCAEPALKGMHTCEEYAPRCPRCAHMSHTGYHCGENVMSMGAEVEMCQCPGS